MKMAFYVTMVCTMLGLLGAALFFLCNSETMGNSFYKPMAPALRTSEFDVLKIEIEKPVHKAQEYFDVLARIERLKNACYIAQKEEKEETTPSARWMFLKLNRLENDFAVRLPRSVATSEQFRIASEGYRSDPRNPLSRPTRLHPWAAAAWFLFYFGSMPFVIAHYFVRLREMKCRLLLEAFTNWQFPLWVAMWPIGLFRYPKAIDPRTQLMLAWQRMYRFVTLLLGSILTFCAAAPRVNAQEDDPETRANHTLHLDISTLTLPQYLGLNGGIFHPAPVQQTSVTVSLPKGFYVGVRNSVPLGDRQRSPNFGYELDYSAGWNGKFHGFNLNGDVTYIDVFPLGRIRGDVLQLSWKVSHAVALTKHHSLEPFVWIRCAMPTRGTTPTRGTFLHEGVGYAWTGVSNFSLNASVDLMHDTGAFGFDRGYFGKAGVDGSWKLLEHWKIQFPVIRYSIPITHVSDGRQSQLILGGGIAYHR